MIAHDTPDRTEMQTQMQGLPSSRPHRLANVVGFLIVACLVTGSASSVAAGYGDRVFNSNVQTSPFGYPVAMGLRAAQSFLVAAAIRLQNLTLYVNNTGVVQTDGLVVTIETDNAGGPSGLVLASSANVRPGLGWLEFPFLPAPTLQEQTTYWIVASSSEGPGEGYVWHHSAADTVSGEAKVDQGLGWVALGATDMTYLTYGVLWEPTVGLALQGPRTAEPGASFSYTVFLNNTGFQAAPGSWANLTVPLGIAYVSDDASDLGGTRNGPFNWSFPSLANGPHRFHVSVRLDELATAGSRLTSRMDLDHANSTGVVRSVASSSATLVVGLRAREVFLAHDGIPDTAELLSPRAPSGTFGDFDDDGKPGLTVTAGTGLTTGPAWSLRPPLARPFHMEGDAILTLYLDSATPSDAVTLGVALLDQGVSLSPVIITSTAIAFNPFADWELITVPLGSLDHWFERGNATKLVLFNEGAGDVYVGYNTSWLPSRLLVNTHTYVAFESVRLSDSRGPSTNFSTLDTVRVEANVSHPLGSSDLAEVRIRLTDPDGMIVAAFDPLLPTATDPAFPSAWRVLTYLYPSPTKQGTYAFLLTAYDTTGASARIVGTFLVRAPVLTLTVVLPEISWRPLDSVMFGIHMNNTGQAGGEAWLNVTLPSGLSYVSDTASTVGGTKTGDHNWSFQSLAPGPHSFELTGRIGAVPGASVLAARFELDYSDEKGFARSAPPVQKLVLVGGPRLVAGLSLDRATLHPTESLTITVTFDNVGDADSPQVWINLTRGPYLLYWKDDFAGFKDVSADPLRFALSPVSVGSHAFTLYLNGSAGLGPGTPLTISVSADYALSTSPLTARSVATAVATGSGPIVTPTLGGVAVANPGDVVSITLSYSNLGNEAAIDVFVALSLGPTVIFVSSDVPPSVAQGSSVAWSFSSVPVGIHAISISGRLRAGLRDGDVLVVLANVSFRDAWGNRFWRESSPHSVRIAAPVLSIDIFPGAASLEPGDLQRVTISYANLGAGIASHIWINLSLPDGIEYVGGEAGFPPELSGSRRVWHLTAVGTYFGLFHVDLRVSPWVPHETRLSLVASVNGTDANGNFVDGAIRNVEFFVETAAVTVRSAISTLSGTPGEELTAAVFLNNTGSRMAALVRLNLTYGPGLSFLGDTSGMSRELSPGSVSWLALQMAGSDRRVFNITFRVEGRPGDVAAMSFEVSFTNSKGIALAPQGTGDILFRVLERPGGFLEQPTSWALIIGAVASGAFGYWAWSARRYRIEEVFLINRAGILLHHFSQRMKARLDKDRELVGAMLMLVQEFVQDTFKYRKDRVLKKLEFGGYRLLIERGKETCLAVVFVGTDTAHLRRWVRRTVLEIEGKYGSVLESWNGDSDAIIGVREVLERRVLGGRE